MTKSAMFSLRAFLALACAMALLLAPGCAGLGKRSVNRSPEVGAASETNATSAAVDALSAGAALTSAGGSHVLQPGDEIDLEVFREPDISGNFTVSPAGEIRHSILGAVAIGGLTIPDAEAKLTRLFGERYLVNPRVMIRLLKSESSQIVILGEVKSPGVYQIQLGQRVTLLQAIARAGGFTDLASPDRVRIVRKTNGEPTTIKVHVSDMLGGRPSQGDVPLEPNDVIMVPQVVF